MTTDKRAHPRYAIALDAEIDAGESKAQGRTQDLSLGGFCMQAKHSLAAGAACKARIALVFAEGQFSEHLEIPSTVMWSTPIRGAHQIGVKFGPLGPQIRGYLEMFIKFLEGGEDDGETP